ncbi:MAG TPA: cation:dicarboxylase symporter family transporter [Sphingomonas sp.]|jgi:Na+/H+-dicarboxylate symporter|uniref:dicarboxylate/amino acid:cation symporter n=1 Tax=Sphingomonas sp. TaxID=28214 RepID=UPI002EDA5B5B
MSSTVRILLALLIGLATGAGLAAAGGAIGPVVLGIAEPVGKAWLNGLQMPLVPLVFGLLVTGIGSAAQSVRAGGIARRAMLLFAFGLLASTAFSAVATSSILSWWPVPAGGAAALGSPAPIAEAAGAVEPSAAWLLGFIPVNPIRAAADGEMVAVVLFALVFGFAASRIAEDGRAALFGVVQAMVDTLMVIVGWVLVLAPIGVFALGLVAGYRSGLASAGTLLHYVALIVAICLAVTVIVYPIVLLFGRIGLARFARAAAPAQAIAFSTQSSIASLPAMIAACDGPLAVVRDVRSIVLPLAISLFRVTSPAANIAVALYLADVHGVTLSFGTIAIGVLVAAVVSLAAVGLPAQISFFTTIGPICLAMGIPVGLLPLLLAVETVPDIFRTMGNVTADMALARIIGRRDAGDAA